SAPRRNVLRLRRRYAQSLRDFAQQQLDEMPVCQQAGRQTLRLSRSTLMIRYIEFQLTTKNIY
ncbi:MAG: hypothetical protein V1898_03810, partial [Patescibacteria group bacterium]